MGGKFKSGMLIANKRAKAQNFQNCSEKHLILVVSRSQLNVPVRIRTNYSVNLVLVGRYQGIWPHFPFRYQYCHPSQQLAHLRTVVCGNGKSRAYKNSIAFEKL